MGSEIDYIDTLDSLRERFTLKKEPFDGMERLSFEERTLIKSLARQSSVFTTDNPEVQSVTDILKDLSPLAQTPLKTKSNIKKAVVSNSTVKTASEKGRKTLGSMRQKVQTQTKAPDNLLKNSQEKIKQQQQKLKAKVANRDTEKIGRQIYKGLKTSTLSNIRSRNEKHFKLQAFKQFEKSLFENNIAIGSPEFAGLLKETFPELNDKIAMFPEPPSPASGMEKVDEKVETSENAVSTPGEDTTSGGNQNRETEAKEDDTVKQQETTKEEAREKTKSATEQKQEASDIAEAPAKFASHEKNTDAEKNIENTGKSGLKSFLSKKPTEMLKKAESISAEVKEGVEQKSNDLKEKLPELPAPTGIAAKKRELPEKELPEINTEISFTNEKEDGGENQDKVSVLKNETSKVIENVPEDISEFPDQLPPINAAVGPAPQIALKGANDPEQLSSFKETATERIKEEKAKADAIISQDKGLDQIIPEPTEEVLKYAKSLPKADDLTKIEIKLPEEQLKEVEAQFDEKAKEGIQQKIAEQEGKLEAAEMQLQADSDKSNVEFEQQLKEETKKTAELQKTSQEQAKADTAAFQEQWQAENEQRVNEYSEESEVARQSTDAKVQEKIAETDQTVATTLSKAQADADKAVENANKKATDEKSKTEKDKSWWNKAADAVSSVFNQLKEAVNNIFDGLIQLVNKVIETAKTAVAAVINMAKSLITGFISAFGELLKGLVNVLFAAFPAIAQKFNALIDKAIAKAIEAVEFLAEGLIKIANALLNTLGTLLTAYLEAYKAALNAILDVVNFILVGIAKILKGVTNLVLSAKISPEHFFGQMSEELLGQDVTQPLPNEREPIENTQISAGSLEGMQAAGIAEEDTSVLKKQKFAETEVEADQVVEGAELDAALMSQMAAMPDGSTVEFGSNDDEEHDMAAVKQDAIEAELSTNEQETPSRESPASPALQQVPASADQSKVGPFSSPMQRAGYLIGTMKDAVVKWFAENKIAIIAGLIAGIAGVILANIVTGGAVLAALPLLMQVIGAYFAAEGIYQTAKHFGGFLSAAWPGNLVEGATKLARGLAVLTIELVFALLFGGKAALKGAKTAVKTVGKQGVKGAVKTGAKAAKAAAKKAVKETAKAATDLAKVGKNGAKAVVRNGKVAMKGVRKGFAKGAKTFDELGQKLSKKLRFKKFRMRIAKRRFKLEGEVNPWVLLASGKIVEVNIKEGDEIGSHGKFRRTDGEGDAVGYLVGKRNNPKKSKYVENLEEMDEATRIKELDELELKGKSHIQGYDSFDYEKAVKELGQAPADAIKNRSKLTSALGKSPGPNYNAHHIIPVELVGKSIALRIAIENGFKFNGGLNGIWLKRFSSTSRKNKAGELIADSTGTHASHPRYSEFLMTRLNQIDLSKSATSIKEEVENISSAAKNIVSENPNKNINLLFKI